MPRKYDLSKLTEDEKEQLKDYVNAIKETKKAAEELLEKAATEPKNEGSWGGPRKNMVMSISENETKVPEQVLKFASKKGVADEVLTMAKWLSEIGKKIVGGTAIGKYYDTLVLDVTYQGSEIYYDIDTRKIEVNGKKIPFNKDSFLQAIQD